MKKSKIKSIKAREIIDSRGNPTIEVELETDLGFFLASVPSGASKGRYEARELRDGGKRYQGMGVLKAVNNVNKIIAPKLKAKDPTQQREIDNLMIKLDGTRNKSKLGANAILAVSMAVCRAGAAAKNLPLYSYLFQIDRDPTSGKLTETRPLAIPRPCFNVINGGVHAGNELDFQEFMVVAHPHPSRPGLSANKRGRIKEGDKANSLFSPPPPSSPSLNGRGRIKEGEGGISFSQSLQMTGEVYQELKKIIKENYIDLAINLGDEGGFAPPVRAPEEALNLILTAAKNLGYHEKIKIIIDIAASQFYEKGRYKMKIGTFTQEGLVDYYLDLISKYPIIGLEDPFSEEDWEGWQLLIENCKLKIKNFLVIGDDLLATNPQRIKLAKKKNACNALIIKPNQIGTITEAIEAVKLAKSYGWKIMVSHRSGETNDDFIADFAVGVSADFIKAGAPARGERVAKYNRLLKIAENI